MKDISKNRRKNMNNAVIITAIICVTLVAICWITRGDNGGKKS